MSSLKTHLQQSADLRQEMKINPRLYQAMELLYMPLQDLQQHLKQEMQQNPFLELTSPDVEREVSLEEEMEEQEREAEEDEIDWEEILLDGFQPTGGRSQKYDKSKEFWQPTPTETRDLSDHLRDQLHHLELSDRDRLLGEEIVGNIGADGYLACSLDELVEGLNDWFEDEAARAREEAMEEARADEEQDPEEVARELDELFRPYTVEEAEGMLEEIQRFDPPGVGARDTRECILLQLRDRGEEDGLPYEIVRDHFDSLINHRWTAIGKELGISAREVQDAADELGKLDPKPGTSHTAEEDQYVIPDLIVEKIDGEYMVFLNDTSLPRLRISRTYREIAKNKDQFKGENKEFITSKLSSANWIIQAIEQRRQTMLKVMNFIVDRQREFFEKGVQHLRPLTLREVADAIDMHESTVSRVTNEKYCQTPRGVYHLKFFFSSGLSTTTGEDISARGVKDKIKNLVEEENSQKPLTDKAIVERLEAQGVQIARRTVAKYRDQLGILPARMRKRV